MTFHNLYFSSLPLRRFISHRTLKIDVLTAASSIKARKFSSSQIAQASTTDTSCDLHIVHSPFPPISSGSSYPPMPEFVSQDWNRQYLRSKVAVVDGTTGQTRTFSDYDSAMRSIGASLQKDMNVGPSDTVALFSPNHVDYVPIILGVGMTGARVTPVNPLYKEMELAAALQQSQSKIIIAHERVLDVALKAISLLENSHVEHVVCIPETDDGETPQGTINLKYLKGHPSPLKSTLSLIHHDTSVHPFIIPYSSGTTGLPKGVCLSHSNLVANLRQTDEVEGIAFPSDARLISPLPSFHIYGLVVSCLFSARNGQQLITMSGRFDLEQFCQLVEKHKPHRAHLVPPIILGLARSPLVDKYDLSSLNMIVSAAAPLSSDLEREVKERIGCTVKQAWGMSELSPIGTFTSDYNIRSGSVGQLVSSTHGKIVDVDTGRSLGPGENGELLIKVSLFNRDEQIQCYLYCGYTSLVSPWILSAIRTGSTSDDGVPR